MRARPDRKGTSMWQPRLPRVIRCLGGEQSQQGGVMWPVWRVCHWCVCEKKDMRNVELILHVGSKAHLCHRTSGHCWAIQHWHQFPSFEELQPLKHNYMRSWRQFRVRMHNFYRSMIFLFSIKCLLGYHKIVWWVKKISESFELFKILFSNY